MIIIFVVHDALITIFEIIQIIDANLQYNLQILQLIGNKKYNLYIFTNYIFTEDIFTNQINLYVDINYVITIISHSKSLPLTILMFFSDIQTTRSVLF